MDSPPHHTIIGTVSTSNTQSNKEVPFHLFWFLENLLIKLVARFKALAAKESSGLTHSLIEITCSSTQMSTKNSFLSRIPINMFVPGMNFRINNRKRSKTWFRLPMDRTLHRSLNWFTEIHGALKTSRPSKPSARKHCYTNNSSVSNSLWCSCDNHEMGKRKTICRIYVWRAFVE